MARRLAAWTSACAALGLFFATQLHMIMAQTGDRAVTWGQAIRWELFTWFLWGTLAFPVVANVDARPNTDPARVKELLVRQVDGAVRWEQAVRLMHAEGVTHAIEIGPGKVLAGLCKRIAKDMKVLSVGDVAGLDALPAFLAG